METPSHDLTQEKQEQNKFDKCFDEYAGEDDKKITIKQFIDVLDHMCASVPEQYVLELVAKEEDGKDLFNRDEAWTIYNNYFYKTLEEKKAHFQDAFDKIDTDRSKGINRKELEDFLNRNSPEDEQYTQKALDDCFNDLDRDESGTITRDELIKAFTQDDEDEQE